MSVLRPGLALLATIQWLLGCWTLRFPAHFYAAVPTVDLTPPYNEHLFRDFGGATLGLAVVLTSAAVWLDKRLVVVSLLSYLAFAVPHLVFHLGHLHGAGPLAAAGLVVVLVGAVLLPLGLLVLALRTPHASDGDGDKDLTPSTHDRRATP